jgi:hypothetical protein
METMPALFLEAEREYDERMEKNRIDDTLYQLVTRLTKITGEITFAAIPSLGTSYYI